MLSQADAAPHSAELQQEAAEARYLASLFWDEEAISDLIAYAAMLEARLLQRQ